MSSTDSPRLRSLREVRGRRRIGVGDRRRHEQRDRRQEEQPRLEPRADPVVLLHVMLQPAEQERRAQHEQRVGDDRAGERRLDQHVLAGAQRRERDDELGQVAERRVEQAADRVAGLRRDRLGRVAEQRRERHDGQHREHEQQGVRSVARPSGRRRPPARRRSSQSSGLCRISFQRRFIGVALVGLSSGAVGSGHGPPFARRSRPRLTRSAATGARARRGGRS